jgi:hypothetical protein
MREYRGKTKEKDWVYGYLVVNGSRYYIIDPDAARKRGKKSGVFEIILETVGQWTGDRDINHNKIYEGQILKCTDRHGGEKTNKYLSEVYFEDSTYLVENYAGTQAPVVIYTGDWAGMCEIKGNTYDNPELMEEINNERL